MCAKITRPQRIVAGIDFSAASFAAARWIARWLAKDSELTLVHSLVVPEIRGILAAKYPLSPSLLENAKAGALRRLREFSGTLPSQASIDIREGRPADVLAAAARDHDADLVVVGKHGERPNRGYTGRTADSLIRSAPAPVLMAAGTMRSAPVRLLVALTYSSITPFVIGWVRRLQAASGAEVVAIHVVGSAVLSHVLTMSSVKTGDTPGTEELDEIFSEDRHRWEIELTDAGIPEEKISAEVVFGEVSDSIITASRDHRADMIIMGSHAGPVRRWLLGSAASAVLRQAEIPVLIVVEPETQETTSVPSHSAHHTSIQGDGSTHLLSSLTPDWPAIPLSQTARVTSSADTIPASFRPCITITR